MTDLHPSIPAIESTPWQGTLHLEFAHQRGATQLLSHRAQAPLKIQRPFYPEGPSVCHSVILHTAGGIVGGDLLTLGITLQPHAHALITTAAANRIYRTNGQEARQTLQIEIAPAACLEWLPQDIIVFNQAIYRQDMRIELAPGATWLGWEILRFGRTAHQEKFLTGHWRSHTEIWQQGKPLWIDRQWLPGGDTLVPSLNGLAESPIVGSFAFVGQAVQPDLVEQVRSCWKGRGEAGVTRLQSGLLCRYRGHSSREVRRWFLEAWQKVRQFQLQKSACLPRVWQLEQNY